MKKILFAFALALLSVGAQAQVKFGVKGGLNVTNMSLSKEVLDASNRAGFYIGPTVKFSLPVTGLGLDLSLLYDQRSAKLSVTSADSPSGADREVKEDLKTQQLVVPLNVRYTLGLGETAGLLLYAGPQIGFNVSDKEKDLFANAATWSLKSTTFSINVGAGVMLLNHLQASVNYSIACGSTGEVNYRTVADAVRNAARDKAHAHAWQIGVAYYF